MSDFLELPEREQKPRQRGLTYVMDGGMSLVEAGGMLELAAGLIDLIKLGWGTSYVTEKLAQKVELYQSFSVPVVLGGTLGEIALMQGKFDRFVEWLRELGLDHIEISDGATGIDRGEKLELISGLSQEFTVLSEVGSKDPAALVAPFRWVHDIREELQAGAERVLLEARESGTAGLYRPNGEVREGLVEEIEHEIDHSLLVFEAPLRPQQSWLINHLGPYVNLANIAPKDVVGLETLRLGLRSDTIDVGQASTKPTATES